MKWLGRTKEAAMRKKEERKKHDKLALRQAQGRLATSRYFSGTGSGHCHFCLLPLKTYTKTNVAMAWRDFLLTTDDEYRFTCGGICVQGNCLIYLLYCISIC